jgi:hypothetical protein
MAAGFPSTGPGGEAPRVSCDRRHLHFFEAKQVATTPAEIAYLREHFCTALADTCATLSDADRAAMLVVRSQHRENGQWGTVSTTDPEQTGVPCCSAPPAERPPAAR